MKRSQVRLSLVQLCYSHGRDPAEAVRRAKDLEAYVLEPEAESPALEPEKGKPVKGKKSGNADILS